MPIIPEVTLPNDADLQPLYDAAKVYGEASVACSTKYGELKSRMHYDTASKHPDLKPYSGAKDDAYRTMTAVRQAIQDRFPGLSLQCPAPWVGWDGDVDKYRKPVYWSLRSYVDDKWQEANKDEMADVRDRLLKLPKVKSLRPGIHVLTTNPHDVYKIGKITHNGKRINAVSAFSGTAHAFRPDEALSFRRISIPFVKELIRISQSQRDNLDRFGMATHDPPEAKSDAA